MLLFADRSSTEEAAMKASGLSRMVFEHQWKMLTNGYSFMEYTRMIDTWGYKLRVYL